MSPERRKNLKQRLIEEAGALGFDAVGVADAGAAPKDRRALEAFLKAGRHGDMAWMADGPRGAVRGDPQAMMPGARTAIVLGRNYAAGEEPLAVLEERDRGAVSVYARGKDYHDVLKKRLKQLARWLQAEAAADGGDPPDVKVFVDTAPLMEKPLAQRAGIGWQGKHTNLVSRAFGSWLFLGEILTSLDLPPDRPEVDHCGSCDACLRACPTDAFPAPYRLDATRCISYLTIEHKDAIAPDLMARMGNHVYGCDDCLAVCPWNKFAEPTDEDAFRPRPALAEPPRLATLARLDDAAFRETFAGSPVKRTGRDRFVRNVMIAIGNSGDASLAPVARELADDPSDLVADAARWAARRLSAADD
ncbi:MAG: tRNA epoxyqueuosine(34) reductase QueG [Rhodospirillales bacterium CG15_BIG_FIL_POST_REV_8_21_14_020_66_15]|nr:MAG: tRNA epoxyqueuosine(34) reductase QueG [Rhodospirillales bacterium CG15_BIG_FIL_POST_REV_8_21_14_020_66_15]